MKKFSILTLSALVLTVNLTANASIQPSFSKTQYELGTGIYDITGPAAERGMMGYAEPNQKTAGLHNRLWARAFIIKSNTTGKRVVFLNVDLGQSFLSLKQGLDKKLAADPVLNKYYNGNNVMMSAIHTHAGPGGYSHYLLYNLSTLGYSKHNYQTIVDGMHQAIKRANANLTDGKIKFAEGKLPNVGYNRSPDAYVKNPAEERALYPGNMDRKMSLLRFDSADEKELGLLNWFPLHGTAMNNTNHWISGDSKGYAAYAFEKMHHSDYGAKAFVAGFAQTNAGDISPNSSGHEGKNGFDGIDYTKRIGEQQLDKAIELYNLASDVVKGKIDYRHTFLKMSDLQIDPKFSHDHHKHVTCPSALGVSMFAGTSDGEGLGEGMRPVSCKDIHDKLNKYFSNIPILRLFKNSITQIADSFFCEQKNTNIIACQGESKPVALETSKPFLGITEPLVPQVLPIQLFVVGNVAIAGIPFEITTMAGRRMVHALEENLKPIGVQHVMIAALSNGYAGYITTPEEYTEQQYEGASDQFGRWTLDALIQELTKLGTAIKEGKPVPAGPQPKDLSRDQTDLQTGVEYDRFPINKYFGAPTEAMAKKVYARGEHATATFWGGHPKNSICSDDPDNVADEPNTPCKEHLESFLYIEKQNGKEWDVIKTDKDWDTLYEWKRDGISFSKVTITWMIPDDAEPGVYRIRHMGHYKYGWDGKIYPYEGPRKSDEDMTTFTVK